MQSCVLIVSINIVDFEAVYMHDKKSVCQECMYL